MMKNTIKLFFLLTINCVFAQVTDTGNEVGIGVTIPKAKLHVHESSTLGSSTGNFQILSRISGIVGNHVMENKWLIRDENGSNWLTSRFHNGISVDGSFLTPGINTRTWWERDPISGNQYWGNAADVEMALVNGNLGVGTANPSSKLEVKDYSANTSKWVAAFKGGGQELGGYTGIQIFNGYSAEYNKWVGLTATSESAASNITGLGIYTSESSGAHTEKVRVSGNGNVGIGTIKPLSKTHIYNGASGGAPHYLADVTIEDNDDGMVSILTPSNRTAYFGFGNEIDNYVGGIQYEHANDRMVFRVNDHVSDMTIDRNGYVGIGTTDTKGFKLGVNGKIAATEVKVAIYNNWSDFVFEKEFDLPTLKEVEQHIKEKGHLKDIPSAEEVKENGIFLGDMNAKLLQKIEELTLYTIEQEKEIEALKEQNKVIEKLEKENTALIALSKRLTEIEKLLKKQKLIK